MATIEINGTGGILEGDLEGAIINVNTDKLIEWDGTSNHYITVADDASLDITGEITISMWVNTDNIDSMQHFVDKGSNYALLNWSDSDKFNFYFVDSAGRDHGSPTHTSLGWGSDEWHHIAVTYNDTESRVRWYMDGAAAVESATAYSMAANSDTLELGRQRAANARHMNGHMADIRIYDTELVYADIQKLASKMFVGVGSPVAWWKLNEETASGGGAGTGYIPDASQNSNQGTITGTTWDYNAFGVDIQDSTTTVSNLIVESGQLNTKALNYLDFEAGDAGDKVEVVHDTSAYTKITVSAWVNFETIGDTYTGIVTCMDDDGWNDGFALSTDTSGSGVLGFWVSTKASSANVAVSTISTGQWYHLVGTYDGTNEKFYIDGVLKDTNAKTWSTKAANDTPIRIGAGSATDGSGNYWFDGKIRDVRIWKDVALSSDQVNSLYRGSYNTTPTLGYKLDEASGNAAGWGTTTTIGDVNGANRVTTGSLKVNGAARVLDNGSVL